MSIKNHTLSFLVNYMLRNRWKKCPDLKLQSASKRKRSASDPCRNYCKHRQTNVVCLDKHDHFYNTASKFLLIHGSNKSRVSRKRLGVPCLVNYWYYAY